MLLEDSRGEDLDSFDRSADAAALRNGAALMTRGTSGRER